MIITRPPGRSTRTQLADRGDAIFGAHRAEQPAGVVDDREIERVVLERQPRRRRDFDFDEHAGLAPRPCARAPPTLRPATTATARPDRPTLRGDRAEPPAVRAADLHEAVAHLHAGHADDERVGILPLAGTSLDSQLDVSAAHSLCTAT